jgi:hypothetical protein
LARCPAGVRRKSVLQNAVKVADIQSTFKDVSDLELAMSGYLLAVKRCVFGGALSASS